MPPAIGVIPARFASHRFPGKPLASLGDRTLIEEVWRRVTRASSLETVLVATEDRRVVEAVERFGGTACMTSPDHPSGTDRVAEVVEGLRPPPAIVVNVQGDEPLVTPTAIDRLVDALSGSDPPEMATLSEPIGSIDELLDPNVVKLVAGAEGRALYFSRLPIPYLRSGTPLGRDPRPVLERHPEALSRYRRHQGLYAYRTDALRALTRLPPSPLEQSEGLEQLRALEAGLTIRVLESDFRSEGVDSPEDLVRVVQLLREARSDA